MLTADDGTVVGSGAYQDDKLKLTLLEGYSGFVTLTVTGADGHQVTVEALIGENGEVTIVNEDLSFEDLGEAVANSGGEVEVEYEEELASSELPEQAKAGKAKADEKRGEAGTKSDGETEAEGDDAGEPDEHAANGQENADDGAANADDGAENANDQADEGRSNAGERTDDDAQGGQGQPASGDEDEGESEEDGESDEGDESDEENGEGDDEGRPADADAGAGERPGRGGN